MFYIVNRSFDTVCTPTSQDKPHHSLEPGYLTAMLRACGGQLSDLQTELGDGGTITGTLGLQGLNLMMGTDNERGGEKKSTYIFIV